MDAPPTQKSASDTKEKNLNRLSFRLGCVLAASVLSAGCGSDDNNGGGNVVNITTSMNESQISSAFSNAAADSTIQFAAGTYHFTNTLTLAAKNNVTVKGAGIGSTILDWSGQTAGGDGLIQQIPPGQTVKTIFQGFTIQDTFGDGLKVTGANGLHVSQVAVSWPTRATHGGYGIYPVQSKNILIENCVANGASDTGIYVGQSDTIVVRDNEVAENVAGIEIENSFNADVTGNNSHNNTVGFLAFDLPDLPQVGGHNIRVYGNQFVNNNTPNFAASGTVALVPAGTGGAVMANSKVEVFNNTFTGNATAGFAVISCFTGIDPSPTGQCAPSNPSYNPFSNLVHVHNNTFSTTGTNPLQYNQDQNHPSFALAYLLSTGFPPTFTGPHPWADGHVSEVLWDGVALGGGNPFQICHTGNTAEHYHFANLQLLLVDPDNPDLTQSLSFDDGAFSCTPTGFPLPAVPVPTF
jgi:parallel beta-helix repeat protein